VSEPHDVAALHAVTSTHEKHHVLSYWAVPVIGASSGSVVGCLVVASPVGGTPRPWMQFWLGRATRLLALAIDRERSMAQLRRAAYEDSLTGVANRARLFAELEHRLIRSSVAVLFMDLDDLKGVNDTYGHAIGDEALVAAARRIQSVVRPHDLVARMGGDEFVVACSDVHSISEAEVLAQRVVDAFADPFALGPHRVELGISIGVACSGGASSPSALFSRADAAMYAAKQAGKRRWRAS
jgi:diguanylate cyclase (GGDEF)-like protein